ncbi:C-GCAxxG-C-C family (seleno)protein [Pseudodesulfovibrio sp. zrk46]|uniref:C-GCAxxG-C-C family (seleno)protein n=1 Tax=Pseudodesulfovibrio sp. zrk46 TaxID=2725288 RepID=UPI001448DB27|nr:C-GCAxxG-C-C family (seleno)protein [Pseudodesulfovibrio sp. zrk46]QJB56111.1 DUF3795 domain-containing protein [Pseudodesulfovibrio sp. zrk46]
MSDYVKKRVTDLFGNGQLFCAETVLAVMAEAGGRDPKQLVGMATGFCSGAARTNGQCGAVSGAIMGIGLYAGRTEPGGDYEPAYALVQDFLERFNEKCGSINCLALTGCDFSTPEGQERFAEKRLIRKCIQYAVFAIDTALELLRGEGYLPEMAEMLKSQIAPCGLSCGKCLAYDGGPIQVAAQTLTSELGDKFGAYAKRFEGMNPVFANYGSFKELLDFMAGGSCSGCREKGCLFKACRVPKCAKEHGVDFCFQCDQFPCEEHGMPDALAARWKANNEAMADRGVEAWFVEWMDRHRYL